MDDYEATRTVFSRIQSLDPENASKIMGLLLLQDHAEKEMIRLAFGPEALVQSVVVKAKKELGLSSPVIPKSSSPTTPSTPSSPSPFLRQNSVSSRIFPNSVPSLTIPNPSSAMSDLANQEGLVSPGTGSVLNPASLPFYGNGSKGAQGDLMDDFPLKDQLSFLNENSNNPSTNLVSPRTTATGDLFYPQQPDLSSSPSNSSTNDSVPFPSYWGSGSVHRRSFSVSDVLGSEDPSSGFGWRTCMYFARGYCKNGNSCRFVHGDQSGVVGGPEAGAMVGSPSKIEMMDQCHELLRSKSASQSHRIAAASQLMGGSSFPYSPKMNFLLQQQQSETQRAAAAAALMMDEDLLKFGRSRLERGDFMMNGVHSAMSSPASRQIYLTFPADSTFKEDDVSNYFSNYGPVQDVRIPYQQKRMFGFVTFMYPETVKIILAKGNPHFVCDARVLVKPYKEKGKVPDKNKPHMERAEFSSPCGTPTALDSRDPFDLQLGARMFYNGQDMLWRRKLEEQADLQHALELQSRRLMNLQLLDVKKQHHQRALSAGSPIPSPAHIQSPTIFSQSLALSPFHRSQDSTRPPSVNGSSEGKLTTNAFSGNEETGSGKESPVSDDTNLPESLEHNLPDSPFASPMKSSAAKFLSAFDKDNGEAENTRDKVPLTTNASGSALDMASFKSYNCQMPRFSSGHGAIGMYAGNGGPTCPVGI